MAAPPAFNVVPSQHPLACSFYEKAVHSLEHVKESNPQYKQEVGHVLFPFVTSITSESYAPKITGMIIALHISELRLMLECFD